MRGGRYRIACRAKSNSDGSRISSALPMPSRSRTYSKRAVHGQRRRREHRRPHAVEQQLPDDGRDVDRRGAQEDALAAELDEVHVVRVGRRAAGTGAPSRNLAGAARERGRGRRAAPSLVGRLRRRRRSASSASVASTTSSAPVSAAPPVARAGERARRSRGPAPRSCGRSPRSVRERELGEERAGAIAQRDRAALAMSSRALRS